MYYLTIIPSTKNLFIWKSDTESDIILHFVKQIHGDNIATEIEFTSSYQKYPTTTLAHIGKNVVALAEDLDSLIGAATLLQLDVTCTT